MVNSEAPAPGGEFGRPCRPARHSDIQRAPLPAAGNWTLRNKANSRGVSSLKCEVSSWRGGVRAVGPQTSNLTPQTRPARNKANSQRVEARRRGGELRKTKPNLGRMGRMGNSGTAACWKRPGDALVQYSDASAGKSDGRRPGGGPRRTKPIPGPGAPDCGFRIADCGLKGGDRVAGPAKQSQLAVGVAPAGRQVVRTKPISGGRWRAAARWIVRNKANFQRVEGRQPGGGSRKTKPIWPEWSPSGGRASCRTKPIGSAPGRPSPSFA
jgi:hypothetical protein